MCPAISTCHSDLILHSRVSKEPIIVAYTAFSKRQVSSFMSFYSNFVTMLFSKQKLFYGKLLLKFCPYPHIEGIIEVIIIPL